MFKRLLRLTEGQISCLVNSDIHLICSGNRQYYYDKKKYFINEISRISNLVKEYEGKKVYWKNKFLDQEILFKKTVESYEAQVTFWREKSTTLKLEKSQQTEIDVIGFNEIMKNNDSVINYKNLNYDHLTESIEKIKYNCSKAKCIGKEALLSYISDIYTGKIHEDIKNGSGISTIQRVKFNNFVYDFMKEKYKLHNITILHCEEIIIATRKYKSN